MLTSIYFADLSTSVSLAIPILVGSQSYCQRKKTKKTLVVIDYGNTLYFNVFNGIIT